MPKDLIYVKVRKSDRQVVEKNSKPTNPDPNLFLEIPTNFSGFNETDIFVFNEASQMFYPTGPKPEIVNPPVQQVQQSPFASADGFRLRAKGFFGVAAKNSETILDFEVPERRFINGTHLILKGHQFGDSYDAIAVDKNFVYAGFDLGNGKILYPATPFEAGYPVSEETTWQQLAPNGVELDKFIDNFYVAEDVQLQKPLKSDYPAQIYPGLFIRIVYRSTGRQEDVSVAINGLLHMKEV